MQAHDANPAALQVVQTTLKQARVAFAALHPIAPVEGELTFFQNQTESLANATVVIESLPEEAAHRGKITAMFWAKVAQDLYRAQNPK